MLALRGLPKSEKDSELAEPGPGSWEARRPAASQSCLRKGSGLGECEDDLHTGLPCASSLDGVRALGLDCYLVKALRESS